MLRSILVALDGSPWSAAATTLGLRWAGRYGARLLGLGVVDLASLDRGEPVPMGAYAYKQHRDEALRADAHRRVMGFLEDFRARSEAAGLDAAVLEGLGDPAERILREVQRCDLGILGRQTHFHFETQDEPDATLAKVLRTSSRPVVVVPRTLPEGGGVVVAYGGGRESARTLQVFESLGLADNQEITVITVHPDPAQAETLASLAGDFLSAHGRVHHLRPIVSATAPAEVLLDEIRRRRPGLLVMGAHGHHPVRDLFATSVTRAVLADCPVPALVGA
jgi:nucleotide-binding universal stress UspA family protein